MKQSYVLGALIFGLAAGVLSDASRAAAPEAQTSKGAAEAAWKDLLQASKAPLPPVDWGNKQPTDAQRAEFDKTLGIKAGEAADKARYFYTTFPNNPKASEAQIKEKKFLDQAIKLGQTNRITQLKANPLLTDDERFSLRLTEVNQAVTQKQAEGMPALIAQLEKGARELIVEFPDRSRPYELLLAVANMSDQEKASPILKEIIASKASDDLKEEAQSLLKSYEAIGKPVDISFTSIDGRKVDLKDLKNKVVLVDFWATWCGPCVKEVPNVKHVYEAWHDKGFEIVGISFDKSLKPLKQFVMEREIPWPQYFEESKGENVFGARFGIQSIPTMWLIDKKGLLHDLNGRENLEGKVKTMLAD